MDGVGHKGARADAPALSSVEGILLRAALLAGLGAQASVLAKRLAAATAIGDARSCLDAGAPIQLTVDAPGPAGLRIGLRLGDRLDDNTALETLVPEAHRRCLTQALAPLPPASHASIGVWLFWTQARQSIFVDLRDRHPTQAVNRVKQVLNNPQRQRLEQIQSQLPGARPWALRVEAADTGLCRVHLHWIIGRQTSPEAVANTLAPGHWPVVVETLSHLVRRPGRSGRWVFATPLDDHSPPALRVVNTAWVLTPEDTNKPKSLARLMAALGGCRDHAQALWSLCQATAETNPKWRVGRACEVRVDGNGPRARLFLTPQVSPPQAPAAANQSILQSHQPSAAR